MYGSPVRRHSLHTHVMLEERVNYSEFPRAACRSRVGGNLVGYAPDAYSSGTSLYVA